MFATIVQKELKATIYSPRFFGSFAICSVLILLSVFTGLQEYQAVTEQYETLSHLVDQEARQATSWGDFETRAVRRPDPMQIFVSGVTNDIGRWSLITSEEPVKLRHSTYTDDPIFAVFRFADFAFIVMFVLSLMAIQFTYNAINGERESGTLRLVFSNAVPRAQYLLARCAGAWLGLAIPLGIPILLSLLMVMTMGVHLTAVHWAKIGTLLLLSLMLFTFFIVLGVLMSTLTRRSSVSFLTALLVWVLLVMIIPRGGVMAAGGMVDVPRVAEIESQRQAFSNEKWNAHIQGIIERLHQRDPQGHMSIDTESDSLQKIMEREIDEFGGRLYEDLRQKKIAQEQLAWQLSRLSPVSAYQLAAMNLAETDTQAKDRNEDLMGAYRSLFNQFVDRKIEETGDMGGISISMAMDSETGEQSMTIDASRDRSGLDVADMPRFSPPSLTYAEVAGAAVVDLGLLVLAILVAFVLSFVAFLKYDVR